MGFPVDEIGGRAPGGGGMGFPVDEIGGRCGIGARAAGASVTDAAGATGASGVSAGAGAGEEIGAGAAGVGASRRGPALPDEEITRFGGAGFASGAGAGAGSGIGSGSDTAGSTGSTGVSATTGSGSTGAAGVSASGSVVSIFAAAFFAGAFLAADFFAAAFLTGASGSSGCTSRTSPSRSALRRTRSAWASTTLEEWLFTPIPSATHRSKVSLLVRPSSRASSYTRMLDGNCYLSDCGSGPKQRSVGWARPSMTAPRNGSLSSHGSAPSEE
jgi:hypothetical protein